MLQSSGRITLGEVAFEFQGIEPHKISEYYGVHPAIPVTGIIRLSHFYNTSLYQVHLNTFEKTYSVYVGQSTTLSETLIVSGLTDNLNPDNEFTVYGVSEPINGNVSLNGDVITFTSTGPVDIPGSFKVIIKDIENFSVPLTIYMNVIEEPQRTISPTDGNCFINKELGIKAATRVKPGLMCEIVTGNDGDYENYPRISTIGGLNASIGGVYNIASFVNGMNGPLPQQYEYTLSNNFIEPTEQGTPMDAATSLGVEDVLGDNYTPPNSLGDVNDFETSLNNQINP